MTGYLHVKNWSKYQHYKDRRPPWIKLHVGLLDDYDLTSLEPFTQLVFDRLLLLAAVTDNRIPDDAEWISNRVHLPNKQVQESVNVLASKGFLTLASRAPARSASVSVVVRNGSRTEGLEVRRAWERNAPPLIRHTDAYYSDRKIQRKLAHALELYGEPSLVQAIDRYAIVLADPLSVFDHRYPFADFLDRERKEPGCSYFLTEGCLTQWRRNGRRNGGVSAGEILSQAGLELESGR